MYKNLVPDRMGKVWLPTLKGWKHSNSKKTMFVYENAYYAVSDFW